MILLPVELELTARLRSGVPKKYLAEIAETQGRNETEDRRQNHIRANRRMKARQESTGAAAQRLRINFGIPSSLCSPRLSELTFRSYPPRPCAAAR